MKEERREGEGERRSGEMSGYVGWNSLAIG